MSELEHSCFGCWMSSLSLIFRSRFYSLRFYFHPLFMVFNMWCFLQEGKNSRWIFTVQSTCFYGFEVYVNVWRRGRTEHNVCRSLFPPRLAGFLLTSASCCRRPQEGKQKTATEFHLCVLTLKDDTFTSSITSASHIFIYGISPWDNSVELPLWPALLLIFPAPVRFPPGPEGP